LTTFRAFPPGIIGNGLMLAITNEGDPIPRSCHVYIHHILFRLLRKSGDERESTASKNPSTSRISTFLFSRSRNNASSTPIYTLPALELHALGDLIVLRDRNSDAEDEVEEDIQVNVLSRQELQGLLFANFFAHQKDEYVDVAAKLASGEFNGRNGWGTRVTSGW
jgi:hypothetical protein